MSTTDPRKSYSEALGLEKSELDDIPLCPQKLGRQARAHGRRLISIVLDGIKYSGEKGKTSLLRDKYFDQMVKTNAIDFSMNFFHEPGMMIFSLRRLFKQRGWVI